MIAPQNKRLFIMLADKCNFRCDHCMVNASSDALRFRISPDDLSCIAKEIDANPDISVVHFTGGEPSLFLHEIENLQKMVKRDVRWSMTTNGSFSSQAESVFSLIKLNEIVISFDRYHSPFISKQSIQALIDAASRHGITPSLHAVYDTIADIAVCEGITGIKPIISKLSAVGRGKALTGKKDRRSTREGLQGICPATTAEEQRYLFLPGKGFTSCCGPLVWNDLVADEFLYSKNMQEKREIPSIIGSKTFASLFDELRLSAPENASFETPCDACEFLFSERREEGLPSIAEIAKQSSFPHTFPCTAVLANDTQESLSRRFTLKYVFKGDGILPSFEMIDNSASALNECQINVTQIPPSENAPVRFFQKTFIEKNRAYLDNNEIESQLAQFEVVMSGPWHKQYYTRRGSIVAMFFAGDVDGRVIPNESTFHLLFFGYDRESLSECEAKAVRSHVIASIKEWNSNDLPVTSISHAFNRSSLAFEEKIGLQPVLLRVSENSNEA